MRNIAGKLLFDTHLVYSPGLGGTDCNSSFLGGVMKEDRMDVEPCYPLFSADLESAEPQKYRGTEAT